MVQQIPLLHIGGCHPSLQPPLHTPVFLSHDLLQFLLHLRQQFLPYLPRGHSKTIQKKYPLPSCLLCIQQDLFKRSFIVEWWNFLEKTFFIKRHIQKHLGFI